MKISHVAMYVERLEEERTFFEKYFGAVTGEKYFNPKTGFSSYILRFDGGAALEIMHEDGLLSSDEKKQGYAHLAVSVGDRETVVRLTQRLGADGYVIASQPRTTGDGYFESVILDREGNQIEITE